MPNLLGHIHEAISKVSAPHGPFVVDDPDLGTSHRQPHTSSTVYCNGGAWLAAFINNPATFKGWTKTTSEL